MRVDCVELQEVDRFITWALLNSIFSTSFYREMRISSTASQVINSQTTVTFNDYIYIHVWEDLQKSSEKKKRELNNWLVFARSGGGGGWGGHIRATLALESQFCLVDIQLLSIYMCKLVLYSHKSNGYTSFPCSVSLLEANGCLRVAAAPPYLRGLSPFNCCADSFLMFPLMKKSTLIGLVAHWVLCVCPPFSCH